MAYRRSSIIARTKLFYQQQQQQRISPSFSHISSSSNREEPSAKSISRNSEIRSRFLIPINNAGNSLLSSGGPVMRSNIPAAYGLIFHRNLSKLPSNIEDLHDAATVVGDKAVEAAAPVLNEVAVAANLSNPAAAFQYLIDYVHCYTGFGWWGAIAATALLMRFIHLPFLIYEMKYSSKYGVNMKEQIFSDLDELEKMWKEGRLIKALCFIYKSKLIIKTGAVPLLQTIPNFNAFFLCVVILDMSMKVPSFATGGTLWFMDLTTPDHSMRLPIMFALTLWIRQELNPMYRVEGRPYTNWLKSSLCGALALVGFVAAGFPSSLYLYGITSNLFSIVFGIVMMDHRVPKALGIPMKPPSTDK